MNLKQCHLFISLAIALLYSSTVLAQAPELEVKAVGISYYEAPPGRDKNMTEFMLSPSLEEVKVQAVIIAKSTQFAESFGLSDKGVIKVTAIGQNNTATPIGTADIKGFEKISADRKMRTLVFSIARLPDQTPKGLIFEGEVLVTTFKSMRTTEQRMEIKTGNSFSLDRNNVSLSKVDVKNITLKGGMDLTRVASMSIKGSEGKINAGKRTSWSRMGSEIQQDWEFANPITSGNLVLDLYDGQQEVKLPIRVVVGRPF